MENLVEIPFVDIRGGSPVILSERYGEKAVALIDASRGAFGSFGKAASAFVLPLGDHLARNWLQKTNNPYFDEITQAARILSAQGVFALNLSYEWGCTTGVYSHQNGVKFTRVLDWPFPDLGKHIVIAHQSGKAGDFYNITWPGIIGVFQAVAPGRFAAALNQAPLRRYGTGIVTDWIRNRVRVNRNKGLPPAHLLRQVFEQSLDYESAKTKLSQTPVCSPVIFTLAGVNAGQGCVIERLEERACIRETDAKNSVCASNHFETALNGIGYGWAPRAIDSYGRVNGAAQLSSADITEDFSWFQAPVANSLSRLVMVADPASGAFSVQGTEGAVPVTKIFSVDCRQLPSSA